MRISMTVLSGLLLLSAQAGAAGGNIETVERFVEAFNQRDVDKMLDLAAKEIRWMNIAGAQLSTETSTRVQLREVMSDYFSNTSGTRAKIRSITESGSFVHTVEEAFWNSGGTEVSQCSMAMYELADGNVKNVWYFPVHECPDATARD